MIDKFLRLFRLPSAEVVAQRQLEEARRELLEHWAALEYHAGMVGVLHARIARLTVSRGAP